MEEQFIDERHGSKELLIIKLLSTVFYNAYIFICTSHMFNTDGYTLMQEEVIQKAMPSIGKWVYSIAITFLGLYLSEAENWVGPLLLVYWTQSWHSRRGLALCSKTGGRIGSICWEPISSSRWRLVLHSLLGQAKSFIHQNLMLEMECDMQ